VTGSTKSGLLAHPAASAVEQRAYYRHAEPGGPGDLCCRELLAHGEKQHKTFPGREVSDCPEHRSAFRSIERAGLGVCDRGGTVR